MSSVIENPQISDALRSLVICQLAATVTVLTIIMIAKRNYYFTSRKYVTMILSGMILLCVFGAGSLIERMGLPLTWRTILLGTATGLIDLGTFMGFLRNRFQG